MLRLLGAPAPPRCSASVAGSPLHVLFSQQAWAPPSPLCRRHPPDGAKGIFVLILLLTGGLRHTSFLERPLYTVLFGWSLNVTQRHRVGDSSLLLRVRGVWSKSVI